MSHSVSPLGSLSSPSPSPPPNPIDESELSELTDDDHADNDHTDRRPPPQRQRRARRVAPTRAPASSKRKKRGGFVPTPMWGWACKNPSASSTPARLLSPPPNSASLPGPSRTVPIPKPSPTPDPEEEEEEELPTPPRAMEEEEGEDPDPRKASRNRRKKVIVPMPFDLSKMPRSKRGVKLTTRRSKAETERFLINLWEDGHKLYDSNAPTSDEDVNPTTHQDPPPEDDEDSDPFYRIRYPSQSPKFKRRKKLPKGFDPKNPPPLPRSKRGGPPPLARISMHQHNAMIVRMWKDGYKIYDPRAPTSDEDDDDSGSGISVTSDSADSDKEDEMDVDDDALSSARHSPVRPTLDTNLNTSAADLLESFPPSMRASIDPTTSPPDESLPTRPIPDEDLDQDNDPGSPDDGERRLLPDRDMELDGDEDEDAQPAEPSQPPSPTPIIEPEPEQEDEDPDLQPAHRAEALDVLATIELKFALLRERVYVEKMEGLAWEEALVWDGTHPELHHLQDELTKRRDKRLMLASKKRTYEIDALTKRRREEELWCWEGWDIARTEIQTEMIAETNRKRRKLERERRTIERPPGARRIPTAILNPPPAPTLRQIANTFPLPSHLSHFAVNKYGKGLGIYPGLDGLGGATAYPDLASLSPHEIAADIEFLFQHRRLGFGFGMGFGPPMGVPIGVGVGYNSTPPGFGPTTIGFAGPNPTPGFGVNGLGIGPGEVYPPNSGPGGGATPIGGPLLALGSSGPGLGPPALPAQSSAPSQNAPTIMAGSGPSIANADGQSYSQPAMGIFQAPPSIGTGSTGYPVGSGGNGTSIVIGPGGATSTPTMGPGSARIQRPSGFVERERDLQREMFQRDRDMRESPRDRELAQREREREREFGPSMGPGYPAWNSKPPGGMDREMRRREERDRAERNERERERERSQAQPIVPTPTHRHLHPHNHPHSHAHQLQHPPHQPHPIHAHQSHPHQHPSHHLSHGQHPHQHQHGSSHGPPHHHVGQHHHHRHHHHVVHNHHSGSGTSSSGPDGASPLPQGPGSVPGVQTMEIINLSANTSSKSHWKRDEGKLGGSMPGSRPSSTHPLPSHYEERERERDRPIATPFVLAPSHHTMSSAVSPPRHGWTPGPGEPLNVPPFPPPERFHTPNFSTTNGLPHPRPLTTSPPRPSVSSPSISVPPPPSSTGPFVRKGSPGLPKLTMGYSPRLAGPGVVPTGPGVPGVLSTGGILTSGPGVPPGPGIAPAPDGYAGRASPLMGYAPKVGVEP